MKLVTRSTIWWSYFRLFVVMAHASLYRYPSQKIWYKQTVGMARKIDHRRKCADIGEPRSVAYRVGFVLCSIASNNIVQGFVGCGMGCQSMVLLWRRRFPSYELEYGRFILCWHEEALGWIFYWGTRYQLTQPEGTWSFWAPEVCSSHKAAGQRFMEAVRRRDQINNAVRAIVELEGLGGGVGGCRFGLNRRCEVF